MNDVYELSATKWLSDPALSKSIEDLISMTTGIASMLLASFIVLKLGYEYFKASIPSLNDASAVGKIIDFNEVIRVISLMVLLSLYAPLTKSITASIRAINDSVYVTDTEFKKKMKEINDKYMSINSIDDKREARRKLKVLKSTTNDVNDKEHEKVDAAIKKLDEEIQAFEDAEEAKKYSGIFGWLHRTVDWFKDQSISTYVQAFSNGVIYLITGALHWGFSSYIRVIYKILLILGPLAIATSVFWKDKFLSWFEALLNTGLAFLVLHILTILKVQYFDAIMEGQTDILASLGFNVALIGCYLSIFRLTALWIGKPLAGAIMGKAMGAVSTAAGLATAATIKGISAAAGGGKK